MRGNTARAICSGFAAHGGDIFHRSLIFCSGSTRDLGHAVKGTIRAVLCKVGATAITIDGVTVIFSQESTIIAVWCDVAVLPCRTVIQRCAWFAVVYTSTVVAISTIALLALEFALAMERVDLVLDTRRLRRELGGAALYQLVRLHRARWAAAVWYPARAVAGRGATCLGDILRDGVVLGGRGAGNLGHAVVGVGRALLEEVGRAAVRVGVRRGQGVAVVARQNVTVEASHSIVYDSYAAIRPSRAVRLRLAGRLPDGAAAPHR